MFTVSHGRLHRSASEVTIRAATMILFLETMGFYRRGREFLASLE